MQPDHPKRIRDSPEALGPAIATISRPAPQTSSRRKCEWDNLTKVPGIPEGLPLCTAGMKVYDDRFSLSFVLWDSSPSSGTGLFS